MRRIPRALAALLPIALLSAADEARLAAATAAIEAGQPAQAVALLRGDAGLRRAGAERLLLARAFLALDDAPTALAALALDGDGLADWPPALRGEAAETGARAHAAVGAIAEARRLVEKALAAGRTGDAVLALAAELAEAGGDAARAQVLAEALWNRRPRRPTAAPAGLLLARLSDADTARTRYAEVRALPGVGARERRLASEALCRLLLPTRPGECLVAAEQELARGGDTGALPLWRALALAALDPHDGLTALRALPAALRADPAAVAAEGRAVAAVAAGERAGLTQRLERAAAAAELMRWDEVRALVEADATRDPAALELLVRCPGVDPRRLADAPAAADPVAALALGRALLLAGEPAAARAALAPALAAAERGGPSEAWWWAAEAAPDAAAAEPWLARLRALPGGLPYGLAWARRGQALDAVGDARAGEAWLRAAQALPADHPWWAEAAARAARGALGGSVALAPTLAALAPAGDGGAGGPALRFLLAQLHARAGDRVRARRLAEALRPLAEGERAARLETFIASLDQGTDPGPADPAAGR